MPKIIMIRTEMGADALADGRTKGVMRYIEGHEYDVCDRLARDFLSMKAAVLAHDGLAAPASDAADAKKAKKGAPENKSLKG